MPGPVRVAVLNDCEVVVAGVALMLRPYPERATVVELSTRSQMTSGVDVVLYDTYAAARGHRVILGAGAPSGSKLLVYGWNIDEALVVNRVTGGVSGYVRKGVSAEELVEAIEQVGTGRVVIQVRGQARDDAGWWPGRDEGLSAREAEILAFICQGLSSDELGRQVHLDIKAITSHIGNLCRNIGVQSRSQAMTWGIQRGFGLRAVDI